MAQVKVKQETPFSTDPADELPVGVQLSWRLQALIASGRLGPGDQLPSVRVLAEWAGVNVNTVRAVYGRLEEEGIAVTRHGLGTFVADGATPVPALEEIAADAIAQAHEAGASPRDLAIVAMACASVPDAIPGSIPDVPDEPGEADLPEPEVADERQVQRELRRQIARLEAELGEHVRELNLEGTPQTFAPEGRVAGVEELEEIRDLLTAQLSEARAAAERRSQRQARARSHRESMIRDPEAHKWEIVSSEEAGEDGCVIYRVTPRYGPLGALMNWWRVKVSGGCPLVVPREAARCGHRG